MIAAMRTTEAKRGQIHVLLIIEAFSLLTCSISNLERTAYHLLPVPTPSAVPFVSMRMRLL